MIHPYLGHPSQLYGVEEHRLIGGKGDQMRIYQVKNGKGLEMTVCPDRCLDIYRLSFKAVNCGFFSPSGYVAPAFYDDQGLGFLKSFTAGFMTTCGLTNVGAPGVENGENLPQHGVIGNTPAENASAIVEEDRIIIRGRVCEARIFQHKLALERKITVSLSENTFSVEDTVRNEGDQEAPLMLLYHMNLGYPLLSEKAKLTLPAASIYARTEHAKKDLATCHEILPPIRGFEEQCYFHTFDGPRASAKLENPDCGVGLEIAFDTQCLPCLTEWKMMGYRDYVLGLEPGNCYPTGRIEARENGTLSFLQPEEERHFRVDVKLYGV